jgi:amidophosphoribosyltransferase
MPQRNGNEDVMGGFYGVAAKDDCVFDLFFGIDYHSHLGTRRGGMIVYDKEKGFDRAIHNIENAPFRTKFEGDMKSMRGNYGIGCISDYEPQPLLVRSHHGSFALTTVSKINNMEELTKKLFDSGCSHFLEMSGGEVNATELVAALINQKENLIDGINYALNSIDGSLSLLLLNENGIYAARDRLGRTPVVIGRKDGAFCAAFESFAYKNLGYADYRELGPGEVVVLTDKNCVTLVKPGSDMKICTFLWVYYGYPASSYEGISVERMRYNCGAKMAARDNVEVDTVAGVPDSGTAHAVGYANASGVPFTRPFIKYTPTWPRSFMPTIQTKRNLIAKMKLLAVQDLIQDKRLLLIDDSIVRGTQLRETTEFLYQSGAREVHIRPACPPLLYGCKYLNFSRSSSEMDLITRRVIERLENGNVTDEVLQEYADPDSPKYEKMVEEICRELHFTSLRFNRLDDMLESVGIEPCKLCTYCWDGKE